MIRERNKMLRTILILFALLTASAMMFAQVTLGPTATPSAAEPGITIVYVTGSNFPSGSLSAANIKVSLSPSGGSGASATVTAASIQVLTGSVRRVGFVPPASLTPSAPTAYSISVSSTNFSSSNTSAVTLNPSASILSVTPNSGHQGDSNLSVTIIGNYSNWTQGVSTANFGSGITVNSLTINSKTSATAVISVGAGAAQGAHNVTINTSGEVATLASGFSVGSSNHPPTANPGGPYSGLVNTGVNFDGSGSSDPDSGDILSYSWSFGDGGTATGVKPSHTYTSGGTFTVSLTVNDGKGGSDTKTTSAAIDRAPTANPGGPYTGLVNTAVNFDSSGSSDPDNDTLTYSWNFGDGGTANVAKPQHTYTTGGTFTVTLTVNDGKGGSDTKTTSATIDRPPVANAGGPYSGSPTVAISFSGLGSSDPDGDPLTYSWEFGDGNTGGGASPSHAYANPGTYTVTLTVTDGRGGSDSVTAQVTISGTSGNHPPTAKLSGPTSGGINISYDFDASQSSDPDASDRLSFTWDFGDGSNGSGSKVSHTWTTGGTFTVKVTVSDGNGGQDSASLNIAIRTDVTPPTVVITSPSPLTLFNTGTTNVTGTVADPDDASGVTVKVNGVDAVVSNGIFTASNVPLREGVNTITATGYDPAANAGTYSISVTLDTTPPTVSITSPTNAATLINDSVDVSGNVNDAVPGSVNSGDVSVKVNNVAATVSNGSFSVSGLSLVAGLNTITAVATDKAGNTSQTQLQVTLSSQTQQQHIQILSGNGQTGVIGNTLTNPLVVQLVDGNGVGIGGRQITFTVSKSDSTLTATPQTGQTLTVVSADDGTATVLMQLGTRVGVGINQVSVTSPGAAGDVAFTETSTAGPPSAINIVSGNNQTGQVGQVLPLPFVVIVYDAGGNPLSGVPVKFTPSSGGGNFGGTPTATVNTDVNGKATALLTVGQQEGINNNVITANYTGNQSAGVTFFATAISPGDPSQTTISGIVLDNADTPVPNTTITIVGTDLSTVADQSGQFKLTDVPVGTVSLFVDGRTSTRPETFPFLNFQLTTVAGHDNTIGGPIYLPEIDTDSSKIVGGDQDVVLTMKDVPGYQMTIFAHSATFTDGSHVGRMSLSQVHSDKVPMVPPNGSSPQYAGTLQPPGVIFNPPIKVQFPNTDALAPGTVIDVYTYDHDLEQWVSQGPARVSADGSVIVSDPGFGITKSGWHFAPPPPPPKTCTISCKGDACNTSTKQDPPCTCVTTPTADGTKCGGANEPTGKNSCHEEGECFEGFCLGKDKPDNTSCDDGQFCTEKDACLAGICIGYPIKDNVHGQDKIQFGFINQIVQGIRKFLAIVPIGPQVPDAQLEGSIQITDHCCEDKQQIVQNSQLQVQATFPAWSTGDHTITAPPWSGDYTISVAGKSYGVSYGVHGNIQVALTAALTRTADKCADNVCWGGSVGVQVQFTGGVKGELPNPDPTLGKVCGDLHNEQCDLVKIFGDFQTGLQFTGGVDCQNLTAALDWSGLTFTIGIVLFDGETIGGVSVSFQLSKQWTLIGPQHIWDASIPLPQD